MEGELDMANAEVAIAEHVASMTSNTRSVAIFKVTVAER